MNGRGYQEPGLGITLNILNYPQRHHLVAIMWNEIVPSTYEELKVKY
jgi:hypothetical protein